MDAMNLSAQVAIDPPDASKRVKKSFGGNDSHVPSERELHVVEASDTSSSELGILAWRPKSNGSNLIWQPKLASLKSSRSRSDRSMMRRDGESVSSPKKDQDILSYLDASLNPRKNRNNIFCDRDLHGRVDQLLLDGDSFNAVNSEHLYSEHSHTTKKRKVNLEDDALNYKQHAAPASQCSRFVQNPQSHAETSKLKLDKSNKNKCHGVTSVDVDKLYPKVRCSNSLGKQSGFSDKLSAIVSQIESDEIFARELQEQFYHETTRFINIEKVDAKMAWSLQIDEDSKATSLVWMGHSGPGDNSVANLHSPHHSSTLFESHSSIPDHATIHRNLESLERYPEMQVLYEKIGRNLNNEVDLETRLELLEAVEDMLETNTDYDENNDQHVSSCEINTLPLSLVQNGNNEEACYVCLDIPSVGETIRHLPCLHRFHKTCIDPWLNKKPSCPVCKFKIN